MGHIFSTRRGRKVRDAALRRDKYRCQMCKRLLLNGKHAGAAAAVDHTIPIELAPHLALDLGNLRSVCKSCHDGPCQAIERKHKGNPDAIRQAKLAYLDLAALGADLWRSRSLPGG